MQQTTYEPGDSTGGGTTSGGGSSGGGGYTPPDYASLLANDPAFQQLKADLAAQGIADQASRSAAQQRAAVQFGEVPADFTPSELGLTGDLGALSDPTIAAAARNNPYSTVARINQAHQDALRNLINALAARGLLRSGEAGFQLQREDTAYGTGQYDARQKLLDYLAGVQAAFVAAANARQQALQQGLFSTAQQYANMYPNGYTGGGSPPPPDNSGTGYVANLGGGGATYGGAPATAPQVQNATQALTDYWKSLGSPTR